MEYLILDRILWESTPDGPRAVSAILTEHGIKHGFGGKGIPPPAASRHARQVHGTDFAEAETLQPDTAADGVFTCHPGTTVAVKTADCVPVLLTDRDRRLAMAVHAGWRGLTAGILVRAVQLARQLGLDPGRLLAAIGPSIGTAKFQVGREVVDALHSESCGLTSAQAGLCTVKDTGQAWRIDLQSAAALVLVNAGIAPHQISITQACTYSHPDWHSARREGPKFGSNWAWLTL